MTSTSPRGLRKKHLICCSDAELFKAGVPEPLIPAVRAISSDESLEALGDYLPKDCRDVLVDEVQDFSLEALRLIRALSPVEEGLGDPLCTVGDGGGYPVFSFETARAGSRARCARHPPGNHQTDQRARIWRHGPGLCRPARSHEPPARGRYPVTL